MNITGYSNVTSGATSLRSLLASSGENNTLLVDDATSTSSTSLNASSTTISKGGELYSKLEQLKEQDPDKFQQVVSDIADKLNALAQNTTDDTKSQRLSDLAAKFEDVANGGDISELKPPAPPSGGNPAHKAYAAAQSQGQQGLQGMMRPPSDTDDTTRESIRSQMDSIFSEIDDALAA